MLVAGAALFGSACGGRARPAPVGAASPFGARGAGRAVKAESFNGEL